MPKVSICIPAYNKAEYLQKTIDSVLSQTFEDYEIIITDDSPNDSIKDLVNSFDRNDTIKYFKNATTLGSPENWNEGLRKANGEYIKILHHDDWLYDENSLGDYVALLDKNENVDFAFSATIACSALNGNYIHNATPEQVKSLRKEPTVLYCNNFVGAPSNTIFRNKKGLLFDKNIKWLVDIDFYIRILQANGNFIFSDAILSVTNLPQGRVSDFCANDKNIELFEYFYVLDKLRHFKNRITTKSYAQLVLEAIRICKKYSAFNKGEIRQSGFIGAIPLPVLTYFNLYKTSKLSARAYLKMLRLNQQNTAR